MPADKYEDHPATQMCSMVSRRMEESAGKMHDFSLASEGRFSRIEANLEQISANLKDITDTTKSINIKQTDFATDMARLQTQMNMIKWLGSAVGLAVIGLIVESFYILVK